MKNLIFVLLSFFFTGISAQGLQPGILFLDAPNSGSVHEQGVQFYTNMIEQDPSDVKSLLLRSELYSAMDKTREADADIRLALAINPYGYLHLGKVDRHNFFTKKNYAYSSGQDADENTSFKKSYLLEDEYIRLMGADDLSLEIKSMLENTMLDIASKDYALAYERLMNFPESYKDNPLYLDLSGVLFVADGEIEHAIKMFDKAIEKDPQFTIAYHNRAVANKLLGNLDLAQKDFEAALEQRADIAKIKFSKGKLLELKGDDTGAKKYYQNAIYTTEEYPEARLNYSVMLKAAGEYTEALIEVNDLIKEYPDEAENYYVRGGLYFIYGEYLDAVKDFDTYLETHPDDADVIFYKGLSHVMAGNEQGGCNDIKHSLEKGHTDHAALYLYMCE